MYIKIRVNAGAGEEKVVKESEDHYVISVKQKAERNMANKRLIEIVKTMFRHRSVRIVSGHQSPSKILAVD